MGRELDRNPENVKVSNDNSQLVAARNYPSTIQIPGDWFPHAVFKDALWVKLEARELTGLQTGGRGGALQIGKKGPTFKFLAPVDIIESHAHEWEPYASIQSKILEKIISFSTGITHGTQVIKNLMTSYSKSDKIPSGRALIDIIQTAGNVSVPKYKIDTPLVYRNSQRRRMDFVFTLADARDGITLVNAVHTLMELAAPKSESETEIEFPYVFSVTTEPEGLFAMRYAAITHVSPTWKQPYVKGNPIVCDLTVSIMDMSPLFRKTIQYGGIVNVTNKPAQPTYDNKEVKTAITNFKTKTTPRQRRLGI